MPSSTLWQVVDPSALLVRHWPGEDEHVVFDAASGDLHLLNSPAIAILGRLAKGPASINELCQLADTPSPEALRAVLESLDRLGLVSPMLS